MSWSDINNDTFFLAVSDVFKDLSQFEMVRPHLVARIHMFNEVKKALLTQTLGYLGVVRPQKL
jgi:hypothetical protein